MYGHIRRFIYALHPSRTDVWDFRTYGFHRYWFSAVRGLWADTKAGPMGTAR